MQTYDMSHGPFFRCSRSVGQIYTHPKQLEDNQQGNCSHGKFTLTEGRLITLLLLCGEARYKMSGPGVR